MNRLLIFQKDNSQILLLLVNERPPLDSPISLNLLSDWFLNRLLDPFIQNSNAVGPIPRVPEVVGRLQSWMMSDRRV